MPLPRSLAQLGDFINPDVPALPEPPLLQRLVLESPALPAVALLAAGLVVLIALRAQGRVRHGLAVFAGAVALAAGVYLTGSLVQTDRERILAAQDRLVDAVAYARISEVDELLAEDARVRSTRLPQLRGGLGREAILSTIESTLGQRYRVTAVGTIERQAVIDGPNAARSQVHLRVQSADAGGTFTWFAIDWRLGSDGRWRAVEVEPLFISGVLPYSGVTQYGP